MLNKKYQSQETAIASYNYTDIAEGTGVNVLYGFKTRKYLFWNSVGTEDFHLSQNAIYSNDVETSSAIMSSGSFIKVFDENFDLGTYNMPQNTISSTAYVKVPIYYDWDGTGSAGNAFYPFVDIIQVSGGVPTSLGSASGASTYVAAGGPDGEYNITFPITLSPAHFKIGDTLRFNIQLWGVQHSAVSSSLLWLEHSPQNRDGKFTYADSRLMFYMPFKIDI